MPDARCTRDLVCKLRKRKRTRAYRAAEAIRHSLRNGFTAYIALPGESGLLSPSPADNWLIRARSGRLAFRRLDANHWSAGTTRLYHVRFSTARQHKDRSRGHKARPCHPIARTMPPRPPHPIPRFVTIAIRPSCRVRRANL